MFITHLPILSIELVFVALFCWIESETDFIKDMKRLRKILNGFQVCKSLRSRKPFVLAKPSNFRMHSRHHCLLIAINKHE